MTNIYKTTFLSLFLVLVLAISVSGTIKTKYYECFDYTTMKPCADNSREVKHENLNDVRTFYTVKYEIQANGEEKIIQVKHNINVNWILNEDIPEPTAPKITKPLYTPMSYDDPEIDEILSEKSYKNVDDEEFSVKTLFVDEAKEAKKCDCGSKDCDDHSHGDDCKDHKHKHDSDCHDECKDHMKNPEKSTGMSYSLRFSYPNRDLPVYQQKTKENNPVEMKYEDFSKRDSILRDYVNYRYDPKTGKLVEERGYAGDESLWYIKEYRYPAAFDGGVEVSEYIFFYTIKPEVFYIDSGKTEIEQYGYETRSSKIKKYSPQAKIRPLRDDKDQRIDVGSGNYEYVRNYETNVVALPKVTKITIDTKKPILYEPSKSVQITFINKLVDKDGYVIKSRTATNKFNLGSKGKALSIEEIKRYFDN